MSEETKAVESTEKGFKPSARLAGAVALVMEQGASDWGAGEHLNALRYLVLACSDKAKLPLEELAKLAADPKMTVSVNWADLATEFRQSGKLAECANFKKYLVGTKDYPQLAAKAVAKYV